MVPQELQVGIWAFERCCRSIPWLTYILKALAIPRKRARLNERDGNGSQKFITIAKRKGRSLPVLFTLSELMNMPLDIFFEARNIYNATETVLQSHNHTV